MSIIVNAPGGMTDHLARKAFQTDLRRIVFVFDGDGSVLTTGVKESADTPEMTFNGTIIGWEVFHPKNEVGSIVITLTKQTLGGTYPDYAVDICGTNRPTVTSAKTAVDNTLVGWGNTALVIGDMLRPNIVTVSNVTLARLELLVRES